MTATPYLPLPASLSDLAPAAPVQGTLALDFALPSGLPAVPRTPALTLVVGGEQRPCAARGQRRPTARTEGLGREVRAGRGRGDRRGPAGSAAGALDQRTRLRRPQPAGAHPRAHDQRGVTAPHRALARSVGAHLPAGPELGRGRCARPPRRPFARGRGTSGRRARTLDVHRTAAGLTRAPYRPGNDRADLSGWSGRRGTACTCGPSRTGTARCAAYRRTRSPPRRSWSCAGSRLPRRPGRRRPSGPSR